MRRRHALGFALILLVFSIQQLFAQCELQIVYVTASGTKYHRNGCQYLSSSKIAKTLQQAVNEGYTACSVCDPPTLPCSNPAPDLSIAKTHSGQFTAGQNGTFTLRVQNVGAGPTTGTLTVSDTVPASLSYVSSGGSGWAHSSTLNTHTWSRTTVLAAGASSDITLTIGVSAGASGSISNTATISTTGDSNSGNNSSTDTVTLAVPQTFDLQLTKSHGGSFQVGGAGTFSLAVKNVGSASSSDTITLTDTLPAGLTYASASGAGWSCSAAGQTVTCTRSTALVAGSTSTVTLNVFPIASAAAPSCTNSASVSCTGDSNAGNNSSSCQVLVAGPPPATFKKTFYFPHFADGGGVSTIFSISNLSGATMHGNLTCLDPNGNPLTVPFSTGADDSIPLELTPHETELLRTTGTSNPVKSGFVRVELDQTAVSGVAIFKYASGPEASVLPVTHGREFSLFVERTSALDTGIAFCRSGTRPITLRLFDLAGGLLETQTYDFAGRHKAEFLGQIFAGLPQSFSGLLEMESEEAFSPVGLRFGGSVLSTIPVFNYLTFDTYFSPNGGTRQALIDAINAARKSIDIAIYSFTADQVADALIAAKSRGVAIRIVADTSQAGGSGSDVDRLISAGLNVQKSSGGSGGIMHHKFAIFDGKLLLTGSYNWSANAEDNNYENAIFIRSAEVVGKYQAHFDSVWN